MAFQWFADVAKDHTNYLNRHNDQQCHEIFHECFKCNRKSNKLYHQYDKLFTKCVSCGTVSHYCNKENPNAQKIKLKLKIIHKIDLFKEFENAIDYEDDLEDQENFFKTQKLNKRYISYEEYKQTDLALRDHEPKKVIIVPKQFKLYKQMRRQKYVYIVLGNDMKNCPYC